MKPRGKGNEAFSISIQKKFLALLELPWDEFIPVVGLSDNNLVRKRLIIEQQGRCNKCDNYEWLNDQIALELEHINGNHHDNTRDNVELLCPNCHSMTKTWRGRNKHRYHDATVTDEALYLALITNSSIRQALIAVGLAGKGNNYKRAYEVLAKNTGP